MSRPGDDFTWPPGLFGTVDQTPRGIVARVRSTHSASDHLWSTPPIPYSDERDAFAAANFALGAALRWAREYAESEPLEAPRGPIASPKRAQAGDGLTYDATAGTTGPDPTRHDPTRPDDATAGTVSGGSVTTAGLRARVWPDTLEIRPADAAIVDAALEYVEVALGVANACLAGAGYTLVLALTSAGKR